MLCSGLNVKGHSGEVTNVRGIEYICIPKLSLFLVVFR